MKHLDLFSGIGGAAIAVDAVWPGSEHTFVEKDPFCRAVLHKHYPTSTIHGDINDYIQELTGMPAMEYIEHNGLSKKREIQRSSEDVRTGTFNRRDSGLFSDYPSGDVEDTTTARGSVPPESETGKGESLLSGNESERPIAEHSGESNRKRIDNEKDGVRKMRGKRSVQRRENGNPSASSRLSEAAGRDVVMPEMSSRVAQEKQSEKVNGRTTTPDPNRGRHIHGESEIESTEGRHEAQRESVASVEPPVILTAGVPCQPASQAGRRKGKEDNRWLWPQTFAVIKATQPRFCVLENVGGLLTLGGGLVFKQILSDLENQGYECECFVIPACAVNAPHRRDRVWIVGHAKHNGGIGTEATGAHSGIQCEGKTGSKLSLNEPARGNPLRKTKTGRHDASDAESGRERSGESKGSGHGQSEAEIGNGDSDASNAEQQGQQEPEHKHNAENRKEDGAGLDDRFERQSWNQNWLEVATRLCGVDDGLDRGLHSLIMEVYGTNKMGGQKKITEDGFSRWKILRGLWDKAKSATPSSLLYQFGLCDSLPEMSSEAGSKRWLAQEEKAETMRDLWERFHALPFKKAQDVQSELLEQIGEIQRNEAVVIKKNDQKVFDVWARVYLPTGKANNLLKELRERFGVEKEEVEIFSASKHRAERLKGLGNAWVPAVAEVIMNAIKET